MTRTVTARPAHPTRWTVKQLSGPRRGAVETFASEAAARMECCTLADLYGIAATIYAPANHWSADV
ncbi:hypothetical protein D3C75_932740 [compost metagenome]